MYDVILYDGGDLRAGAIIHSAAPQNRRRKLASGSVVDADNAISSFTFEIFPTNPGYEALTARQSHVRVRDNATGRAIFTGRVLDVSPEMSDGGIIRKTVVCEDRRGYLLDSVQPFRELQYYDDDPDTGRNGLEVFIDLLLENHNAQVEGFKRIRRGRVTVRTFETTEGVYKQLNWESTWDCIREKLLDSFGGHVLLREEGGELLLDYLAEVGTLSETAIELGRNMVDARETIDPKELITRLVPLGAKLTTTDAEGREVETEERLTISGVNGGLPYIEAEGYAAHYGVVYGTVIWDDVTDPANLLRKGTEYLAAHNALTINVEVSALNLSAIGIGDRFELYALHPVVNRLIGLNEVMQISRTVTNIVDPAKSSFTLGDVSRTLSDVLMQQRRDAAALESSVRESVSRQMNTFVESCVESYARTLSSDIEGLKGSYTKQSEAVSALGTFREKLINFFTADAAGMEFTFGEIVEALTGAPPEATNYLRSLITNFRFSANGLDIGRANSPIALRLINDRISFLNNGVEVAYISDNKLYILDAQFLRSIIIGNYQFVLEDNGSMSLVLAGGGA